MGFLASVRKGIRMPWLVFFFLWMLVEASEGGRSSRSVSRFDRIQREMEEGRGQDDEDCSPSLHVIGQEVDDGRLNVTIAAQKLQKTTWKMVDSSGTFQFEGFTDVAGVFKKLERLDFLRGNSTLTFSFDAASLNRLEDTSEDGRPTFVIVPFRKSSCTLKLSIAKMAKEHSKDSKGGSSTQQETKEAESAPVAASWQASKAPPSSGETKDAKSGSNSTEEASEERALVNGTDGMGSPPDSQGSVPSNPPGPVVHQDAPPLQPPLSPPPGKPAAAASTPPESKKSPASVETPPPSTTTSSPTLPPPPPAGTEKDTNVPPASPGEEGKDTGKEGQGEDRSPTQDASGHDAPPASSAAGDDQATGADTSTTPSVVVFVTMAVLLSMVVFCIYRSKENGGYQELEMSGTAGGEGGTAGQQPVPRFQLDEEEGEWGEEEDWQEWGPGMSKKAGASPTNTIGGDADSGATRKTPKGTKKASKVEHKD